jgi:formylglycine-generating enzyme required for sulfatase activity
MVRIPGCAFRMGNPRGDGYAADGEEPVHEVTVDPFWMDATAVTNTRFTAFIDATGYRTEAETFGWSFVFWMFLPPELQNNPSPAGTPWWRQVFGADWRHPEGPQSSIDHRMDHPAIHISWNDAQAYCAWAGVRLPTEAEWEVAARGGREGTAFPWGNYLEPEGTHRMNVWQGEFPARNSQADGYAGTAPAMSYEPNGYGLYCMTGNVWEWCADWFSPNTYQRSALTNPIGPQTGGAKVMRGGSYLCHASYCNRYRVDSRSSNTPDSSTGNLGFRTIWS